MKRRRIPWWGWLLIIPLVLAFIVFIALDPLVEWRTREGLKQFEKYGYAATFADASLRPYPLSYRVERLKFMKVLAGGSKEPYFYAEHITVDLDWRQLLRGAVVARVSFDRAKSILIEARSKEQRQLEAGIPDFAERLDRLLPMRTDRIQFRNSELLFIDKTERELPRIWASKIEATIENLATRAALAKKEPTTLAVSATLQKTGALSLFLTADPFAKGLFFSGKFHVADLEMAQFHTLIASKTGLALSRGTADVFAEFDCRDGFITGGVKAVIKNPEVVQAQPGLGNALKEMLADVALEIFTDRVPGRNALATVLPIEGRIDDPKAQLWPTIAGVVRNAFVEGLSESYEHLPPPKAKQPEGAVPQLLKALEKEEGPPRAQPTRTRQREKK